MIAFSRFPPTPTAVENRIAALRPSEYARTRNALDGAVSGLSPYLTHGFVSTSEVLARVLARHDLPVQHKFVQELGWREYFRHVWHQRGEGIFESLHAGVLPDDAYPCELPADVREARTGIPGVDLAVRQLYATGYLHNHARMWLASYLVHLRKVHWTTGADWMYGHLLDGDLASNHLGWQWIAGTASRKPYLFNADNVARFAPAAWHSALSVIDTSYDALDTIARNPVTVPVRTIGEGMQAPAMHVIAPGPSLFSSACANLATGRDVWLVHPWSLHEAPDDLPPDALRLGVCPREFHDARPWSAARWSFVSPRMAELTSACWHVDAAGLSEALSGARSVRTCADPHVDPWMPKIAKLIPAAPLFSRIASSCDSYSSWWVQVTRGLQQAQELPGVRASSEQR